MLDLGTSSLKCAVITLEGRCLSTARAPMSYFNPPGLSEIALEFRPDKTWDLACNLIKASLSKAGVKGSDIAAVSATSQRGGIVLLDKGKKELYAGPNKDVRAFFEGMAIDEDHGERVYRLTGHTPSFLFAPARLAWFRANALDTYENTAHILPIGDWARFRLSGEISGERSALTEVGLLPVSDAEPADSVLKLLDINSGLMPPLSRSGEQVGVVSKIAAEASSLAVGTPVVCGGPDTQCGLLGMGIIDPGQLGILVGWSGPLQMVTAAPCIDAEQRTWTGRHIFENRWVVESTTTEAGRSLDWMAETLGFAERGLGFSSKEPDSPNAYTPLAFLGPRIMDAKRTGLQMGGLLFPTPAGHTGITGQRLVNAALKNLAFAIRGNAMQLEEVTGQQALGIALGGGVARIEGFAQLVTDALKREVAVPRERDATLMGVAACAAVGSGAYNSLPEAMQAMRGETETLLPDEARVSVLEEEYDTWLDMYKGLAEITGAM